ncbi:AAA family ATPase [Aeromonas salmonicida]|uniref:AAA family ATPase n=1 Tax=Aeromonas salmonicida TaxID=645 RepID=UPI0037EDC68F
MENSLTLISFEICNLYGLYTHKILFNKNKHPEKTIILHGKNGVGKTALLKAIIYTFKGNFALLAKIPFDKINSTLSDGTLVSITRTSTKIESPYTHKVNYIQQDKLDIEIIKNSKKVAFYNYDSFDSRKNSLVDNNPWIVNVNDDYFLDRRTGERFPIDLLQYEDTEHSFGIGYRFGLGNKKNKRHNVLSYLQKIKVHLVETNRLFSHMTNTQVISKENREQITPSVKYCAKQLASYINKALKEYGETSQSLDQSFPQRFINDEIPLITLDELKNRLQKLTQKIAILQEQGILDSTSLQPFDTESLDNAEENKLEVMGLYVSDSEKKLEKFDDLSNKVNLILQSLNGKFSNKKVVLSKEYGLVTYGEGNIEIELDALSSGEQHEIVLLFELLFNVQPGTLVLIDEPELSLHVSWQKVFLPELISISENVGFYSILATHSPFIVGDRFDLMVALDSE